MQFHPLAGQLADCAYCGERWDDLPAGWEQMTPERPEPVVVPAPRWDEHAGQYRRPGHVIKVGVEGSSARIVDMCDVCGAFDDQPCDAGLHS